jgi:NitT/TauT family transport system permease protein
MTALDRIARSPAFVGFVAVVALLALLDLTIQLGWVSKQIVASPVSAVLSLPDLEADEHIAGAFFITLGMTACATLMALAIGVPFGYLLYRKRVLGEAYEGWLAAAFSAPLVLLYPLFLVILGRTYFTLIVMGFIPGAIPIILQTRQGLSSVSQTLQNVGRSFNADHRQMVWKIMIPAAAPTMFNGMRIGVMYTLVAIVAIEYLTDFGGLGKVVSDTYFRYEIPETYAAIFFVIVVSMLFYAGFSRIEKWLRPV